MATLVLLTEDNSVVRVKHGDLGTLGNQLI